MCNGKFLSAHVLYMFGQLLTTCSTDNGIIFLLLDFPHISLSNDESRRSLAIIVREIFTKKYRGALYFDVDSTLNNTSMMPF